MVISGAPLCSPALTSDANWNGNVPSWLCLLSRAKFFGPFVSGGKLLFSY